ncbi:MAG: AI-2E family transporter [Gammaproteobacteria bacterium]|nr:AI-2E family transporter [Gammaproteobacteria bacterium]
MKRATPPDAPPAPGPVNGGDRRFYGRVFALAAATFVALLTWQVLHPILVPLCWAVVIAVLLYPLQRRLTARLGRRRSVAAGLLTLLVFGFVAGPVAGLSAMFASEFTELVKSARSDIRTDGLPIQDLDDVPIAGGSLEKIRQELGISRAGVRRWLAENFNAAVASLGSLGGRVFMGAVETVVAFGIMLVVLFFALRDGSGLVRRGNRLVPWPDDVKHHLGGSVRDVIRAVVFGTVATATLQGALVGAAFAVLDLPGPVVFGVVAGLLAMLPVGGTAFVWVPGMIALALQDRVGAALALGLWGLLLVGTIDNLLNPYLVAHRSRVGALTVFVGVIGGLAAFGALGLVMGPLILVLAAELLRLLRGPAAPA